MKEKEKGLRYQHEIDFDVAEMYAKSNCKHCYGRGIVQMDHNFGDPIRKDRQKATKVDYCQCVHKMAKKYG